MEKDIGKIKKNDNTDIIVRVDSYGGKPGVTIREFVTGEKYTGFTKSGTRIPADKFFEFRELITSIDTTKDFVVEEKGKKPAKQKEEKTEEQESEQSEEIEDY